MMQVQEWYSPLIKSKLESDLGRFLAVGYWLWLLTVDCWLLTFDFDAVSDADFDSISRHSEFNLTFDFWLLTFDCWMLTLTRFHVILNSIWLLTFDFWPLNVDFGSTSRHSEFWIFLYQDGTKQKTRDSFSWSLVYFWVRLFNQDSFNESIRSIENFNNIQTSAILWNINGFSTFVYTVLKDQSTCWVSKGDLLWT